MIRAPLILTATLWATLATAQTATSPVPVALVCAFNTVVPAPTNAQFFYVQCDSTGKLITAGGGGLTVGTTAITGGTTTRVLYDNAGVLGEYTISGTGSVAMTSSPAFVTPTLGAALATSINGNTFTTGTYTLTGSASKTLTFSNSLTLAGTDATTLTFPSTSATIARTDAGQTFTGTNIFGITQATSLALGGATIGTNALAVTGSSLFGSAIITGPAAATLQLGAADGSGAGVAQTLKAQGSSGNSAAAALFTIAGSDQTGTTTTGGGVKIRGGNGTSAGGAVEIWTSATSTPAVALSIAADKTATFSGGIKQPYVAKTTTYTVVAATDYIIDCTSGTFTVTMPTAVGIAGQSFIIKNSGTGVITIATTSSQTIDGALTFLLSVQYEALTVLSDGANWKIV